ncbi:putative cytoplasm protein [Podospora fimiseda]|uniref:Cytoplasm protein n=1 Tax=Podospora fimiseda TaxID=252190 RepID=A0AAN7H7Q5_9PEZI|nr:putative cytoplasm protein [Podospora fimiseda]
MAPKIAIVYYSMYGHIRQLADAEKAGIEKAGGTADLYQVEETLPAEVLTKMHAPPKPTDVPVLSDPNVLKDYDGILFGIPTRYGNFPAQWKAFWDKTGGIWQSGGYWGKYAGLFISTASQGGGQESTALAAMSTFAHHGLIYVPLGYAKAFGILTDLSAVRGGSPWGAGTFAGGDGSRQPSDAEKELATIQGEEFYKTVAKATEGRTCSTKEGQGRPLWFACEVYIFYHTMSGGHNNNHNNVEMDDIWGSPSDNHYTTSSHPSDIPRLQQEHTTAGYRDGITQAKSQHVQSGFDEGYSLGATIGARAGQLLGLLEGLAAAIGLTSLSYPPQIQETKRIETLLNEARKELSVQSVFGRDYWGEDGVWRYEVDGEEIVFGDVAGQHPLLKKWDGIVRREAAGYGVDWDVLRDGERDFGGEERKMVKKEGEGERRGVSEFAW